jgi:putative ABC transport system ATP-binding protein
MTDTKDSILRFNHVTKSFYSHEKTVFALKDVGFTLNAGESLSVTGPSGSGKSTLLSLAAGLEQPSSGEIFLDTHPLHTLSEEEIARIRISSVGFIFQSFRLLGSLSALENVEIPSKLQGKKNTALYARKLLEEVGLGDRTDHYPKQLSGGEQQRVAIARAFMSKPKILFADEPTGNLDLETSQIIKGLIFNLQKEYHTSLLIVTHDQDLADRTDRRINIRGGEIQPGDSTS